MSARAELERVFGAALDAVHAGRAVERSLAAGPLAAGRWTALGAGKAACAMAAGARRRLGADLRGCVVVPDGHAFAVEGFDVAEAAHPVPDARAVVAAQRALEVAADLGTGDGLLVLLSGGASALWTAPVEGVPLADLADLTARLLRAGADIHALNCVRKHCSRIKGGRLARSAEPARVLTLAVSDVAGDSPHTIGSGPTAADPTTYGDALAVLTRFGVEAPPSVRAHLERGAAGAVGETPERGDWEYRVVASLDDALEAAGAAARARGLRVRSLGRALEGEARECAGRLAGLALHARDDGVELLVAGGETTVTVRGDGRGGRAQELALAFALALEDAPHWTALFAGTDGADGPTTAAGAVVDAETPARARAGGLDPAAALERNDSHTLLEASGDLLVTGPTQTNVADVALIRL